MSDPLVNLWESPVGVDADYIVSVVGSDGQPVEFQGDEPITVTVWRGDDLAPVPGLVAASWTGGDPSQGQFVASILGAVTAAMAPEYFRVRATIEINGRDYLAYEGWLSLTGSPKTGESPRAYIGLKDLLDVGGDWLPALMSDSSWTNFLADRARASKELDSVILSRLRPTAVSFDARVSGLLTQGRLHVTDQIREAVAYLATHYICERQISMESDDVFARRSAHFRAKWRTSLPGLIVAIDASNDGDGSHYMYVDLSVMSSR